MGARRTLAARFSAASCEPLICLSHEARGAAVSASLVKGVHLIVGVRGARIADRARSVHAGVSGTKSVCVGPRSLRDHHAGRSTVRRRKVAALRAPMRERKQPPLSRGCQMPAMENPYRAFVATAADLICGVRSGVRHCRSASVLLFMVRSSPRPLGEGADPTASDELTLCAWHLAGERTRRVRAPSLRGVLAEAQEPPG